VKSEYIKQKRKLKTENLKLKTILVLLAALMLTAGLWSGQAKSRQAERAGPSARRDEHVIMISIDGMPPDYYTNPAAIGLKAPAMISMKLNGAYADGVEGVYPAVTYPSHTTLVTGALPDTHGIVQNRLFEPPTDPQTKAWYWFTSAIKVETLWMAAKKSGLTVGAVGWPVTAGADIDYNFPEIWDPAEQPITPKRALEYSTPGLVQKVVASLGAAKGDQFRTNVAEYVIKNYRPNLMLVHLIELDDTHHHFGPRSPKAIETMEREDGYVARILQAAREAGIADSTTIFLVSDHGFASVSKKFEPNVVLARAKLIGFDPSGKAVSWKAAAWDADGSCAIVLHDPEDKATAKQVTEIFSKIASRDNAPISQVLERKELDRLGAIPQACIMLEASPGYYFDDALTGPEVKDSEKDYRGTHGYLPSKLEMRSALIMYGQAARVGARVAIARMIDVGPTAAAVLGLSLADTQGQVLTGLLKPQYIPPPDPDRKKHRPKKADSRKPKPGAF
jgi:predicted AlkP superfamily pyrophosphatase or phosphodiesterase